MRARVAGRLPALVVVGGLVIVVFGLSRNLWFFDDDWDYLSERSTGDIDSYLEPHAGHWTLWTVPVFRFLYWLVGMDYYPWYHLPRFLALVLLAALLWRALQRRGAAPVTATAATAVFVVLDTSAAHRAVSIGNYIVMAMLIVVGERLDDDSPPGREQIVVGAALLVAVCAFSTGPILVGATFVVVTVSRRLGLWWRSIVPAALVYVVWSLTYGPDRARDINLLALPGAMLEVLGVSMASLLGVSQGAGEIFALALVGLLVGVAWRSDLDRFDWLALTMLVAFLAVTAQLRALSEQPIVDRYAFVPIITTGLVLVPRLPRAPSSRQVGAIVVAGALLVAVNLSGTRERTEELAEFVSDRRGRVETAAALLAAGEPSVPDSWVTVPLTVEGLDRLVADGWVPPARPEREREARGHLTVGLGPGSVADDLVDPDGSGCRTLRAGGRLVVPLSGSTDLLVESSPPTQMLVRWEEDGRAGERLITWAAQRGAFKGSVGRFELAEPAGDRARVEVIVTRASDEVTICLTER